ncbi:MAG: Rrf2 family transcriptional regulator [Oscillospiraceae bacterium]|nr:Rrf2 family transcriptional regulator [Oscillospiraceae bacterium]
MQIGSKFTIGVHIITAIDYFKDMDRVNSEFLAGSIGVNPVIVRTVISQLREAGIVQTKRGSSGAELAKRLDEITLYDIYEAVGSVDPEEGLFHFHEQPNPECPVGKNIHRVLDQRLMDAQRAMEEKLKSVTLADIAEDTKQAVTDETNKEKE